MHSVERRKGGQEIAGVHVHPCQVVFVHDQTPLVSVVGSGVAVCFWCPVSLHACMAHFVEPRTYDRTRATARFGNVALPKALDLMVTASPSGVIEAQIFGGAMGPNTASNFGEENILIARKFLQSRNIPLLSEDIQGSKGRKIVFQPANGHVAVVKVHQLRREDWSP